MRRKDNIFTKVALKRPKRSNFDLSNDLKTSFNMGELVPTINVELLPGDKVVVDVANMLKFAPMLSPVMHNVRVRTDIFFVPNRILWPNWENFITGSGDTPPAHPYIATDEWIAGSVSDYMGIPPDSYPSEYQINALPFAAYAKIYDDYYRDQNLVAEIFTPLIDGNNNGTYLSLANQPPKRRAWQHDYFTSALPFPQKGPAVSVPLVTQDDIPVVLTPNGNPGSFRNPDTGASIGTGDVVQSAGPVPFDNSTFVGSSEGVYDPRGSLTVDVQADATDINSLRWAFRMQEWLEKTARAGSRYVESLLAHFNTRSSDARLQRAEFIGSSHGRVTIGEVLTTTENTAVGQPVALQAGTGNSVSGGNKFVYHAEEHGFLIGIISVLPDTAYMDGIHKKFMRKSIYDYAWPSFAELGEQEVKMYEVYAKAANPDDTFGYQQRYAEYKFENSRISGEMRSTLLFWNLGRKFTTTPLLNQQFIECTPDNRIFAVVGETTDHVYAHIFNNITVNRALPYYGIPTI